MSGVVVSPFAAQSAPVRGGTGFSAVRSALRYNDLVAATPAGRLDSVEGLVSRLDDLGLLTAARRDQREALLAGAVPAATDPTDGPVVSCNFDPRGGHLQRSAQLRRCAQRFVETREVRRARFLLDQMGQWRALWPQNLDGTKKDELKMVEWVLAAQQQLLLTEHNLNQAAPEQDRFVVVPFTQLPRAAPGCLGSTESERGLLFILDGQSQAEFLATAAHEAAHWSSVVRVAERAGDASARIFGCGLSLGQLFRGLNEAYTAGFTHRIFQHGLRDRHSELGETARRLLPREHLSPEVRLYDTHDRSYLQQRQQLALLPARLYKFYTGKLAVGIDLSPLSTDPFVQTIRTYLSRAYFFGDLTIYAMLHQALGIVRFAELAQLT